MEGITTNIQTLVKSRLHGMWGWGGGRWQGRQRWHSYVHMNMYLNSKGVGGCP